MKFFLYEVVARVVAIYFCVDCYRDLQAGLADRKIRWFGGGDLLNLLLDWSPRPVFQRDTAPVSYWMTMGGRAFGFIACLVVAIFGWFHPDA